MAGFQNSGQNRAPGLEIGPSRMPVALRPSGRAAAGASADGAPRITPVSVNHHPAAAGSRRFAPSGDAAGAFISGSGDRGKGALALPCAALRRPPQAPDQPHGRCHAEDDNRGYSDENVRTVDVKQIGGLRQNQEQDRKEARYRVQDANPGADPVGAGESFGADVAATVPRLPRRQRLAMTTPLILNS